MADLSKLSDADLAAVEAGDLSKVSDAGLAILEGAPAQPKPTTLQKAQASIPGRVVQGWRDPIDELAVMLPKGLEAVTSLGGMAPNKLSQFLRSEAQRVQGLNKANEQSYQEARKATGEDGMDVARFAGNITSPTNLAIASSLAPAVSTGSKILQGAKIGAAGGSMAAGGDVNSDDYWQNKAMQAAGGAAIGGALPAVTGAISRVLKPETNPKVAELLRQGVTPTPGQIAGGRLGAVEEKMQSLPVIGEAITSAKRKANEEFNLAALNRALAPIGEKTNNIGRVGVAEVERKISAAYDDLLPKLTFKPDTTFQQEFANLKQLTTNLGPKEANTFNAITNDVFSKASPNGSMIGSTLKEAESKLGSEAKAFMSSTDVYQRKLGEALQETLNIMRASLSRTNPKYAQELANANKAWANYARIRGAASSTAAGANEGVFSPAQLAMAVRAGDKTVGKGASAKGQALMQDLAEQGTAILGQKVPDSGTAGRLGYGLGGAAVVSYPPLMAGGLAAAPYLGPGRKLAAAMMTQRPQSAQLLAEELKRFTPYLSGAVPVAALGQ